MNGDDHSDDQETLPAAVVERLRGAASKHSVLIPGAVDERILRAARERLDKARRRRLAARKASWLAAAAAVAAALLVSFGDWSRSYDRADIDRNGSVDILDAFELARRIEAGSATGLDINGDGAIDRADVETVAAEAVKLRKGRV